MMTLGTQVAIIDDKPSEVLEIQKDLDTRNVGYSFFDATPEKAAYPEKPIETLNTIFLDLHYGEMGVVDFDPHMPANWIDKLVPQNHKYFLVAWTMDTDDFISVLSILSQINKSPYAFFAAQKNNYEVDNDTYNIDKLFSDIQTHQKGIKTVDIVPGQIIALEEDKVLVKCRVSPEKPIFQVRRFDLDLFDSESIKPEVNMFINIQITSEPGIRTIEIFRTNENMKELFEVEDYFKDLDDSKFIGNIN